MTFLKCDNLVTKMYWARTNELAKSDTLSDNCINIYNLANSTFLEIERVTQEFDKTGALMSEVYLLENDYNRIF